MGRWRGGAPLTLVPTSDDPALGADPARNNDFTYAADQHGRQVPLGSHMRRMNPRDTVMAQLADVNLHRLIRRSTTYGAPYDPDATSERDDEVARGLYFIFLSAKAMATLGFLRRCRHRPGCRHRRSEQVTRSCRPGWPDPIRGQLLLPG